MTEDPIHSLFETGRRTNAMFFTTARTLCAGIAAAGRPFAAEATPSQTKPEKPWHDVANLPAWWIEYWRHTTETAMSALLAGFRSGESAVGGDRQQLLSLFHNRFDHAPAGDAPPHRAPDPFHGRATIYARRLGQFKP
ncbi:hypothetical protein FNU76_22005 [Chitinimonas arctica]|uniref:Uncharacterized protein n=1 Tax=Chitinimonas arctica TaxID=2594795 RepID=A0A516SKY5_9NEIS|nr:hypothetical protein [Chitinimonas arctica]QDQ28809.1 hypothetical protein FNU76_22005 [Chitinimonas arctica]